MNPFADATAPVRTGEELDRPGLEAFLRSKVPKLAGPIEIEQFPGGHSNLTYLVRSGDVEYVLRRPPYGAEVKSAHDMGREVRVLSKLHEHFEPAPKPIAHCDDASILGAPFYLMERIPGVIYRAEPVEGFELSPHRTRDACYSFIETLADLHALDYKEVGLQDLYRGPGYVQRQVDGWTRRWEGSKTEDLPEMDRIQEWLTKNLPADSGASVIHNDFKFDNVVFSPEDMITLVGVLDWEMATVGDPLSDLAFTLTTWRQRSDGAANSRSASFLCSSTGALKRDELIRIYGRRTGRDMSDMLYHFVLALYKGIVIGQQIYYRYKTGKTNDPRFADFTRTVSGGTQRAIQVIETGVM